MTPRAKAPWAALPRTEVWAYWLLSFGSHLYSFYHLHRFSRGSPSVRYSTLSSVKMKFSNVPEVLCENLVELYVNDKQMLYSSES